MYEKKIQTDYQRSDVEILIQISLPVPVPLPHTFRCGQAFRAEFIVVTQVEKHLEHSLNEYLFIVTTEVGIFLKMTSEEAFLFESVDI